LGKRGGKQGEKVKTEQDKEVRFLKEVTVGALVRAAVDGRVGIVRYFFLSHTRIGGKGKGKWGCKAQPTMGENS